MLTLYPRLEPTRGVPPWCVRRSSESLLPQPAPRGHRTPMTLPFSSQDLGRIFDARTITRGRSLGLAGQVEVQLEGDTITAIVQDSGVEQDARITLSLLGRRIVFDNRCTCRIPGCAHLAAGALAALDRFPSLRKPEQQTFLDLLAAAPEQERQRPVFELAPGKAPYACVVSTLLVHERTGAAASTTPRRIAADEGANRAVRELACLLGNSNEARTGVMPARVDGGLGALGQSGQARWHAGGRRLMQGEARAFFSTSAAALPPRSGVIVGATGPWYVDAATGAVARVRVRPPVVAPRSPMRAPVVLPRRRIESTTASEQVIVDRPLTPVLGLTRCLCPDESGRMRSLDVLLVEFDYGGAVVPFDDDRQFIRTDGPGGPVFVRRDRAGEAAVVAAVRRDGLVQMRMGTGPAAKGRMVFAFRGRDAAESWQGFVAERIPALQ